MIWSQVVERSKLKFESCQLSTRRSQQSHQRRSDLSFEAMLATSESAICERRRRIVVGFPPSCNPSTPIGASKLVLTHTDSRFAAQTRYRQPPPFSTSNCLPSLVFPTARTWNVKLNLKWSIRLLHSYVDSSVRYLKTAVLLHSSLLTLHPL